MSDNEKALARKKDAERKRASRARKGTKKRSEMTQEELTLVRELDKKKKQKRRQKLTEEEREEIRDKDRKRKRKRKPESKKDPKEKREKGNISSLLSMRKLRLLQTEEKKSLARQKAKEGMRIYRQEGPVREYKERDKKHKWAVKWKKYLLQNPMICELEEKKKKKMTEKRKLIKS